MAVHDEWRTIEEEPHVLLALKASNRAALVADSWHERVLAAWMGGAAFITAVDPYGNPITVRLADVSFICRWTEEGLQRRAADDAVERQRDALG